MPWLENGSVHNHEFCISPGCHELKDPGSWNVVPQYMVHHHMEITEIEDVVQYFSQFTGNAL